MRPSNDFQKNSERENKLFWCLNQLQEDEGRDNTENLLFGEVDGFLVPQNVFIIIIWYQRKESVENDKVSSEEIILKNYLASCDFEFIIV